MPVQRNAIALFEAIDKSLATLRVDDVVLLEWRGNFLLHLVKEIKDDQLLIGNNLGKTNGWPFMSTEFEIQLA